MAIIKDWGTMMRVLTYSLKSSLSTSLMSWAKEVRQFYDTKNEGVDEYENSTIKKCFLRQAKILHFDRVFFRPF